MVLMLVDLARFPITTSGGVLSDYLILYQNLLDVTIHVLLMTSNINVIVIYNIVDALCEPGSNNSLESPRQWRLYPMEDTS